MNTSMDFTVGTRYLVHSSPEVQRGCKTLSGEALSEVQVRRNIRLHFLPNFGDKWRFPLKLFSHLDDELSKELIILSLYVLAIFT